MKAGYRVWGTGFRVIGFSLTLYPLPFTLISFRLQGTKP
jgi:hypothetical protein